MKGDETQIQTVQVKTEERGFMSGKQRSPVCPKCKSNDIISIGYGYPIEPDEIIGDGVVRYGRRLVKLGGCIVRENNPEHYCKNCKHEW